MRVEFHPEAEQEFIETAARYDSEIPGLGKRFGEEVYRVVEILLENPKLGSRDDSQLRHFVLRRFPFSVVYAVESDLLYVLAIAHGSRAPGYWHTRIDR